MVARPSSRDRAHRAAAEAEALFRRTPSTGRRRLARRSGGAPSSSTPAPPGGSVAHRPPSTESTANSTSPLLGVHGHRESHHRPFEIFARARSRRRRSEATSPLRTDARRVSPDLNHTDPPSALSESRIVFPPTPSPVFASPPVFVAVAVRAAPAITRLQHAAPSRVPSPPSHPPRAISFLSLASVPMRVAALPRVAAVRFSRAASACANPRSTPRASSSDPPP